MRAKKRYGQHFLQGVWADRVVEAIAPAPGDHFVEIGPGPGALTLRLAPRVGSLVAVEVDDDLVAALRPQLPSHVTLIHADVLKTDFAVLTDGRDTRFAGNLPYNVSSPILFRLLDLHRRTGRVRDATFMLQREVAERLESGPGSKDYGILSILFQLHADIHRVLSLPPGAFRPAPRVHSAVVSLSFRAPAVSMQDEGILESMVRSMFTQRRKTLANSLGPFAANRGLSPTAALTAAGIDGRRRAETLQLSEIARLADVFAAAET